MTELYCYCHCPSPVGEIMLMANGESLTGLYLPGHTGILPRCRDEQQDTALFREVCRQLQAYFAGTLQTFDLPLHMLGTPFQQRVWRELRNINFGTTITYAELAARIGQSNASRAVGAANAKNPISIIVPCHRVVGANGALTGYAGGLDRKEWLLRREAEIISKASQSEQRLSEQRSDEANPSALVGCAVTDDHEFS